MKKQKTYLIIVLQLPDGFDKKINSFIDDEILIASEKWGVDLNTETVAKISESAITQLVNKIFAISKNRWTLDDAELTVRVGMNKKENIEITLPSDNIEKYNISLVRTHSEWRVDNEPSGDAILIGDFYEFFLNEIEKWTRTAVFYAVGSYG